ncbi:hypothetical protein F4778DRAFT_802717 [Xylariomycetidae sp. FL2044]|nr:hypothetical protein F4778DRAFT_802717 [Xylariomycetidae sp. FL2044]
MDTLHLSSPHRITIWNLFTMAPRFFSWFGSRRTHRQDSSSPTPSPTKGGAKRVPRDDPPPYTESLSAARAKPWSAPQAEVWQAGLDNDLESPARTAAVDAAISSAEIARMIKAAPNIDEIALHAAAANWPRHLSSGALPPTVAQMVPSKAKEGAALVASHVALHMRNTPGLDAPTDAFRQARSIGAHVYGFASNSGGREIDRATRFALAAAEVAAAYAVASAIAVGIDFNIAAEAVIDAAGEPPTGEAQVPGPPAAPGQHVATQLVDISSISDPADVAVDHLVTLTASERDMDIIQEFMRSSGGDIVLSAQIVSGPKEENK